MTAVRYMTEEERLRRVALLQERANETALAAAQGAKTAASIPADSPPGSPERIAAAQAALDAAPKATPKVPAPSPTYDAGGKPLDKLGGQIPVPPQKPEVGYWTPPALQRDYQSAGKPAQMTQADMAARVRQPIAIESTAAQVYAGGFAPPSEMLPGQIMFTPEGEHFQYNPEDNSNTPVIFDPGKRDWVPRDDFLEKAAQHDPDIAQPYRDLKRKRRKIETDESLEPGIQFGDAMAQVEAQLSSLAKGARVTERKTPQQQFEEGVVKAGDGSQWLQDDNGKWQKVGTAIHERNLSPKEYGDFLKIATEAAIALIPTKKDPKTKQDTGEPERTPTPAEVKKQMKTLVDGFREFSRDAGKAMQDADSAPQTVASGTPTVNSDADYSALPSGTHFIDPEGKERVKP